MSMMSEATGNARRSGSLPRQPRATISLDLEVVCLWSAFGLLLTVLVLLHGFTAEVVQALVMAG